MTSLKRVNKLIAALVVVAMVMSLLPVFAYAADGTLTTPIVTKNGSKYTIETTYVGADGKNAAADLILTVDNPKGQQVYINRQYVKNGILKEIVNVDSAEAAIAAETGKYAVTIYNTSNEKLADASFIYINKTDEEILKVIVQDGMTPQELEENASILGITEIKDRLDSMGEANKLDVLESLYRTDSKSYYQTVDDYISALEIATTLKEYTLNKNINILQQPAIVQLMAESTGFYKDYYIDNINKRPNSAVAWGKNYLLEQIKSFVIVLGDKGLTFKVDLNDLVPVALFNEIDLNTRSYMLGYLKDKTIINKVGIGDNSSSYQTFLRMDENKQNQVVGLMLSDNYGGLHTFTLANIAPRFNNAVDEVNKPGTGGGGPVVNPPSGGVTGGGGQTTEITGDKESLDKDIIVPIPPTVKIDVRNKFLDVNNSDIEWVIAPLQSLYNEGIINGKSDDSFAPYDDITRAEFLKILMLELRLANRKDTVNFDDVSSSDWFYPYVASAKKLGIVNGKSDTEFAPNDNITREEICMMVMRAVRLERISLPKNGNRQQFADSEMIADYALNDVMDLKASGIISGRGENNFAPQDFATRAEATKILHGIWEAAE